MGGNAEPGFDLVDRCEDRRAASAELVFRCRLLVDRDEPGRDTVGFPAGYCGAGAGCGSHAGDAEQDHDQDGEDRNRDREESSERFVGRAHVPGGVEQLVS